MRLPPFENVATPNSRKPDPKFHEVGMSFSSALNALKNRQRVARAGWNGKGMWLVLVSDGYELFHVDNSRADALLNPGGGTRLLPFIGMYTADNCFVPWLASQTDLLAEDWCELNDGFYEGANHA